MAAHKHIDAICIAITLFALLLTILFMNGKALGIETAAGEEDSGAMFTENDQNAAWDTGDATEIILSDEGSTVHGNGAYVYDGDLYIVYAGKYVLSGALSDGTIWIEADGDDKIWLLLDGLSLSCQDDAAIRIEQAGKVFLTLQDGTENVLASGAAYSEEALSAGVDGTLYSRDDLTINGDGALRVTAAYRHGIVCNDDLVITGGTLDVSAVQDAVHANDSVRIKDADLTLSAGDDGITVSNDDETAFLYVESGNISIPACYEGLEAVQITIAGGTLDIKPTDDGLNANGYGGSSCICITGGEISVTVENGRDADGLDSNKDIYIRGGKLLVSVSAEGGNCAIDYGSESGGVCEISGGTVLACGSSGMAEEFDPASAQGFLMQSASAAAGTAVTLKAADGSELLSETVPCSFSSVLVSTPEMKVGDTCTLAVGDSETEMTVDNAASVPSLDGGQLPGGNGLDGGQGPGQGFFGGNGDAGAMPPGELPDETGGEVQPFAPQDGLDGGTAPGQFSGDRPALPQEDGTGGGTLPDMPQGGENFAGAPGGEAPQTPGGGGQGQENALPAAGAESPVPAETLLLLGISAAVLLAGCLTALLYRRRR